MIETISIKKIIGLLTIYSTSKTRKLIDDNITDATNNPNNSKPVMNILLSVPKIIIE